MKKTLKTILITVVSAFLGIALLWGGLMLWMTNPFNWFDNLDKVDQLSDVPLFPWSSSLTNINQALKRPGDWKRIVRDSEFARNDAYPIIDGSTVMVSMACEFARQHLELDDESALELCAFSTTDIAYQKLFGYYNDPQPDLFLGTAPSGAELASAKAKGVEPVIKPVCRDAFVFITHKDNPVDSLTLEQVRDIYSGKIKNWKEVGGKNAKIDAYQRSEGSGSQTGMEQHVMKGLPLDKAPTVKYYEGMAGLVDGVAEYQNSEYAIGYSYNFYVEQQYKNDNIKVLKIEGVDPSAENITNETYPLSVYYYGVIRKGDENKPGGKFLDWILSAEGQECVKQAGYIPLGG